jgi:hypothetical protein
MNDLIIEAVGNLLASREQSLHEYVEGWLQGRKRRGLWEMRERPTSATDRTGEKHK